MTRMPTNSSGELSRTICLTISESENDALVSDPSKFRQWLSLKSSAELPTDNVRVCHIRGLATFFRLGGDSTRFSRNARGHLKTVSLTPKFTTRVIFESTSQPQKPLTWRRGKSFSET